MITCKALTNCNLKFNLIDIFEKQDSYLFQEVHITTILSTGIKYLKYKYQSFQLLLNIMKLFKPDKVVKFYFYLTFFVKVKNRVNLKTDKPVKSCGYLIGYTTASFMILLGASSPNISLHLTLGLFR